MATTTALFVIDIQMDLAKCPETQIPHSAQIVEAGNKILSTARTILDAERGKAETLPAIIVFVQHEEQPEKGPLVRGSDPWKFVFDPRTGVEEERLVAKSTRDTFESNPALASELKRMGIREIIAFGIQSECCVESTCSGALVAGFEVTLLSGAHSTYNAGDKRAIDIEDEVEGRLREKGAKIVPWEEAVTSWKREGRLSCR
ncbi:hypothetical protein N0V88_008154 [Collariella sp. IMI 366227]|nr:hypothetical protein N0V88_008154 [Collariella sp. IMI 366227]